ncbi:malate synthase G [Colwelliaceae bacterium 6471]
MNHRISVANIQVAQCLHHFIEQEVLPGTGLSTEHFWQKFADIIDELSNENRSLLNIRDEMQTQIDKWHKANKGEKFDFGKYKEFLKSIGYLVEDNKDFTITTDKVDPELATLAGPQLVVPVMNARFALNAVNARWGSLYDALYGTDVISEEGGAEQGNRYNPIRGNKVIQFARNWLDETLPLKIGSHQDAITYALHNDELVITLKDKTSTSLQCPESLVGFKGDKHAPELMLFKHQGLHFEIVFDKSSAIAKTDIAGVSDIIIEAALTTIMDCEDSVAAVDAEDKVIAYKNWLGLNKGTLEERITKNDQQFTRAMNDDRQYTMLDGNSMTLKGRSLMFVRNVGHLMTNDAILDAQGREVPEGIMDAMITSLIALHDLQGHAKYRNSTQGSIYIVKPKMHGPEEVAFANKLFSSVEQALQLPQNTIKMGIMDEERRTSLNLKACIYEAKERVVFINTGFLDRTGDEIHTSMEAGPMARKNEIKNTPWISAYENNNVDVGLACGLSGKAQIGKGMWPIPDQMANMLASKIDHVKAGANTAWVPSPTAATLHALHYHQVNVFEQQKILAKRAPADIDDILTFPVVDKPNWSEQEIIDELDNNAQGILGYVVRWVDQGIGCSKVPDINNVGLMEDRATLRISSQHMTNWLYHGICTKEQILTSMKKMAKVVDQQNSDDPNYQAMATDFESNIAFQAACQLVFLGREQPSGYTEPVLHQFRRLKKQTLSH